MLFGVPHLLTLVICGAVAVCVYLSGQVLRTIGKTTVVAAAIAVALVALELFKTWQALVVYGQLWQDVLPLHLCRVSSYLCCVMLILRSYRLFEVAYFWGIGGSVSAMVTPDLAQGFPHPFYLGFFVGHTLVLSSVLFAVSGFDFRPRLRSIGVTAVVSAAYMVLVAMVNWALQTNYLYLCHKPEKLTIYDYLGPWPWYIISIWVIGLVVALICYAPFAQGFRARKLIP
jgi:hypothetical integral membrane protein (TIGR02206 family)